MVFKLFFLVFFLELSVRSESCLTNCGSMAINFPFQLTNQPQEDRCGYPGFDLSCNNQSQTIITFPSSGDFSVQELDNYAQSIGVGDPDGCLPKRLLKGFDPSGTPFEQIYLQNFTLLNCSGDAPILIPEVSYLSCLNGENNSVVAVPVDRPDLIALYFSSCLQIGTVSLSVPEWSKELKFLDDRIWLTWKEPAECKWCFGTCQFKENEGTEVECSVPTDQAKSDSSSSGVFAKYFLLFTVVSFLSLLGFVICISSMIKRCIRRRPSASIEIYNLSTLQTTNQRKGLDDRTIQMYPTTLLGESRQLPKPDDTTCSICLVEYQAKDTLKSIPSCLHYFHASCIDEWLKRNATCPLCRD